MENYDNILQIDGCDTTTNTENDNDTDYETDEEIEPLISPPTFEKTSDKGKPLKLSNNTQSSILPLCIVTNARSLYNKKDNFKKLLSEIRPDIALVSETWERKNYGG